MSSKISLLTGATTINDADIFPSVQSGANKKNTAAILRAYVNRVVFNGQSGSSYSLVAGDVGKVVRMTNTGTKTVTVPVLSGIVSGDVIIIRNVGAGLLTIAASSTTLNAGSLTLEQNQSAALTYVGSNVWDAYVPAASTGGGGGGGDTTPPTVTGMEAIDAHTIVVTFSEATLADASGWSFNNGGALTISSVGGSGTSWTFAITETMTDADTITGSYNSASGGTTDTAANELVTFSGASVTNSIPAVGGGGTSATVWHNLVASTQPGSNGTWLQTGSTTPSGASSTNKLGATGSKVEFTLPTPVTDADLVVIGFVAADNSDYDWGTMSSTFKAAVYFSASVMTYWNGSGGGTVGVSAGDVITLERSGDDCLVYINGGTPVHSFDDAFLGMTDIYMKILQASGADGTLLTVTETDFI